MRILIIIAIIGGAFWAFNERKIPVLHTPVAAYSDTGEPQIILYISKECGSPCNNIMADLNRRRAKFKAVEISYYDDDHPGTRQFKAHGGGSSLPYMVSGNNYGLVTMKSEVASQLALTFGEKYLDSHEKQLYKKHFDSSGNPIIVMYGAEWCGYCRKLEKGLIKSKLDYIEIDLDAHSDKQAIAQTLQIGGYPSTWYGYQRVRGVDLKAVKRTIKTASK